LMLIPSDGGVTTTKTWSWPTALPLGTEIAGKEDYSFATAMIILFIALVLIAILIVALILTRESDGEVDRDIFDYCPACDGELEGDENRCPSCRFNLKKARMQFHDCEECAELVPDLLDNCPYCGVAQDTSKYFEKRERLEIKQTVDLPDEEEFDEEAIVSGTENFEQAVQEFGYDADDLEGHWDEQLADAETEVEAAQDRLDIEIEQSELDDEEREKIVETTLKSIEDSFSGNDIDAILSEKDEVVSHADDGEELSASDAKIRGRLFEITGEKGVMPGDKVNIGGASESVMVGNEVPTEALDFSFNEEQDKPLEDSPRKAPRRRRNKSEDVEEEVAADEKAECGVCGADLGIEELECKTCGAKFE
jgi:RNA polymerase subunit RPABC4/transcription elongation factor Spt4